VHEAGQHGLDADQVEVAIGVISMFNYFTRVADASGIEFDYETPLPAFEPNRGQLTAPRPARSGSSDHQAGRRRRPRDQRLQAAWDTWRAYVLDTDEPISRPERRLLATAAAEEAGDWEMAEVLGGRDALASADGRLVDFARKLSRQPWRMLPADLDSLRAAGYSEVAILHVISVVAHQNADSRLVMGLSAAALD
jgi:hypothetical protein